MQSKHKNLRNKTDTIMIIYFKTLHAKIAHNKRELINFCFDGGDNTYLL